MPHTLAIPLASSQAVREWIIAVSAALLRSERSQQ
jgi:hypothetical protein